MADYRTIKPTIWSDPYFEELNSYEKLLYIYLFSNPHINNAGVMKVSHRKIIFETLADSGQFESAIKKFENDKKVMLFGEYIYVCNFIKHQTNTSSKMLINIHKQLELIPRDIVSVINQQYPELKIPQRYLTDTVSIPLGYPTDGLEDEWERELEVEYEKEREGEWEKGAHDVLPHDENVTPKIKTTDKFTPPTLQEVQAYADNSFMEMDVSQFYEHYTATGWKMSNGRYPEDWTALLRLWKSREKDFKRGERKSEAPHIDVSRFSKKKREVAS